MGRLNNAGIGLAALIAAAVWVPSVWASGIPVADAPSAVNTTKDFMQRVKESKFVMDTVKMANKTSAAIGDAKKSVSEYVVKNKEKIEKKVEKVKKYKEQAEEYKKQYDEYKAQVEDGIEKAKDLKEQAEAGIETAKETVDTAQQAAGAVGDIAQSKIDSVSDKTGVNIGGSSNSGSNNSSSASTDNSVASAGADNAAVPAPAPTTVAPTVNTAPVSTRTAFGGNPVSDADTASDISDNTVEPAEKTVELPQAVTAVKANEEPVENSSEAAQTETKAAKKQLKSSTRRSFKSSALEAVPGNYILAAATAGGRSPLAFAIDLGDIGLKLPDGGTDMNDTFIIPSSISMTCGNLSSEQAQKDGTMDNCLVKEINDKTRGAQAYEAQDMTATYIQGKKEFAAAYIAEAYKAANDTTYFVEKIIDPIEDASATTTMDNYSNMVEMNKAVATAVNGLLKIHSASLALDIYDNYGTYKFVSPEES